MKVTTTFSIMVLFAAVLWVYFALEPVPIVKTKKMDMPASMLVLQLAVDDEINWLQVQNLKKNETLTLIKNEGLWRLKYPINAPADPLLASGLETALTLSVKQRRLQPEKDWSEYGLLRPDIKIGVETRKNNKRRYLYLGAQSPVGDFIYARWEAEEDYFLLRDEVKRAFERSVYSLRLKRFFTMHFSDLTSIKLEREGRTFEIEKQKENWIWKKPAEISGHPISAQDFILIQGVFEKLYVKEFLDNPTKKREQLGFTGEPSAIECKSNGRAEILHIGAEVPERDAFYAYKDGERFYAYIARENVKSIFETIETISKH